MAVRVRRPALVHAEDEENHQTTRQKGGYSMRNTEAIKGVNTIAQYKIMQFINENFFPGSLEIELMDKNTIRGTDRAGESMIFRWNDEKKIVETEG